MSAPSDVAASEHRSGFVAIVGRPNVGKSTLLNAVIGKRIAPVSPRPQTTRRRLLGIRTLAQGQILLVDTPGIHRASTPMSVRMVGSARAAIRDADVALWVVDGICGVGAEDEEIGAALARGDRPVVVALNKIDAVDKQKLLPQMHRLAEIVPGCRPVPVSARKGENVSLLIEEVLHALPRGPRYYAETELTTEPERAIVAEKIREKVMHETRDEVPYSVAVSVDSFTEKTEKKLVVIAATIHVERDSQKAIVIGSRGKRLKAIGQAARREIEEVLGCRAYLELFVRVQANWTRDPRRFEELGL